MYEKRRHNYPAQRIGSEARELNIIAMQEHGAVGYEGQVVMYSIGRRGAKRCNWQLLSDEAEQH